LDAAGRVGRRFSGSNEQLATRAQAGARQSGSQSEVWKKVELCQALLKGKLGTEVKAGESQSSLQLTLEHKKLLEALEGALKKLAPITEKHKDVIGYVFAINGKVNSGDVYGNAALFGKLWPKLLKATAVEAVVEREKDKKFEPVTAEAMKAFLLDAEKGKAKEKDLTKRLQEVCARRTRTCCSRRATRRTRGMRAQELHRKVRKSSSRLRLAAAALSRKRRKSAHSSSTSTALSCSRARSAYSGDSSTPASDAEPLRHRQRCTTAGERIEHEIARPTGDADDPLQHTLRHLTRMAGPLPERAADGRVIPRVLRRAEERPVLLRSQHPGVVGNTAEWIGTAVGVRRLPGRRHPHRVGLKRELPGIDHEVQNVRVCA
jgi:hypothetical protein